MQFPWLVLAVAGTVGYHLVLKVTPSGVNPVVSLAVSYGLVTLVLAAAALLAPDGAPLRDALRQVNWTALALALAIIALDFGFLLLYRSGFDVSLGQLVTQSAAALLLIFLGVALFREKLSPANLAGVALCVVGLWLVSRR
jgi:multidrug transporter EmrE-like cation transporter